MGDLAQNVLNRVLYSPSPVTVGVVVAKLSCFHRSGGGTGRNARVASVAGEEFDPNLEGGVTSRIEDLMSREPDDF